MGSNSDRGVRGVAGGSPTSPVAGDCRRTLDNDEALEIAENVRKSQE